MPRVAADAPAGRISTAATAAATRVARLIALSAGGGETIVEGGVHAPAALGVTRGGDVRSGCVRLERTGLRGAGRRGRAYQDERRRGDRGRGQPSCSGDLSTRDDDAVLIGLGGAPLDR